MILLSLGCIKYLISKSKKYISENGKSSMGAVVEQIQQTYDLQVSGYYSQLQLVEEFLLRERELSLETDTSKSFFEAWEKESESTLIFLQENGQAISAGGTKMRIDMPSKLLLDLKNGYNIGKLVCLDYDYKKKDGYLVAIPCQEYTINGETYTAIGTVYDHSKLDSMLKLKGYDGNAYLFMLDNDGNITYTNQSGDKYLRNYSLLKHLKGEEAITEEEADLFKKKFDNRESGVALLGKQNPYYLGYCPIESNNTILVCIVAKGVVDNVLMDYQKTVLFTTILMAGFILLLFAGLFYSISRLSLADQKAEYEKRKNELHLQTMKEMEVVNQKLKKAKNVATEALQTAENANKAKTDFLSNMSHDIRTPMNAIIGFTGIAMKNNPSDEVKNCLEKIDESSEHLLSLINDVLDLTRIESGKVNYNPVPANVKNITDSALDITKGFLTNRDINFKIQREEAKIPNVLADPARLRDVLVNILSNAVKFTPDGGTITFEARCQEKGGDGYIHMRYRISDTGIGMSEEFTKEVFEEFAQEDSGVRTQYHGVGLGMAIVKKYVDMMGGTISVHSKKHEGTTFTVDIPLEITDKECNKSDTGISEKVNLTGVNVLLVEDNELNAEIAAVQLEEFGMNVERAVDGKNAVEIFRNHPEGTFDVILMDIMMPEMNGYEAAKAIRAMNDRPDGKNIPIIAMTANSFAEDVQASLDAGMNAHLSKPIVIDEVIKTILRYVYN